MEFRKLKNKQGEILTTKEGKEMQELRFEAGDEFIPQFNTVLEKGNKANINGKERVITNYKIKCLARDKNKQEIDYDGQKELFVTLTPAQAKSLKKKVEEGVQLNQHLFVAYEYDSEDYGKQIGLGLKKNNKPAKDWKTITQEE